MNPKPIKKMLLGVTGTWKGFYTVSQVILTSVVVQTQFSINILSSYSYTKKTLDFLRNKDKNKKTTTTTTTTTKSTVILLTLYNTPSLILSDARI